MLADNSDINIFTEFFKNKQKYCKEFRPEDTVGGVNLRLKLKNPSFFVSS